MGKKYLGENNSHIDPNIMFQIWSRSDGRVEKRGCRQTDTQRATAALYSRTLHLVGGKQQIVELFVCNR